MNNLSPERLYNLLPAIYRIRDVEQGEPLRALLGVIEGELAALEADIDGLYDDWFIETCAEWVVPYIGDLLGVRGLRSIAPGTYSQRAYVANTIAYRRRKGTAAVLEQLARDVTGWPARVVEFYQLLATTQYMNHIRADNLATPDLRDTDALELLQTPFSRITRSVDVRRISGGPVEHGITRQRGQYNIPNIGLFLWRLQPYAVERSTPRGVGDERFTFNPLGDDAPLFNLPRTETEIAHLAAEFNVPGPLRRRPLYDELELRRQMRANGLSADDAAEAARDNPYFGEQPVLQVYKNGLEVSPDEILISDLTDWQHPPTTIDYPDADNNPVPMPIQIAVDPALGRLMLPDGDTAGLQVSYAYGFSDDLGGGPYNRQQSIASWLDPLDRPITWQVGVTQNQALIDAAPEGELFNTLVAAVDEWNLHVAANPNAFGIISIMDSGSYTGEITGAHRINLPERSRLALVAADWPQIVDRFGIGERFVGRIIPVGRPYITANISVQSEGSGDSELIVDGLWIEGRLTVLAGDLGTLRLLHTTLVPSEGGLVVNTSIVGGRQNELLRIFIERSICGAVVLPDLPPELNIMDSIIDAGDEEAVAISGPGVRVRIQRATVIGSSTMLALEADDSIFNGLVTAERKQTGCVRFCYLPDESQTPHRYRCQPDTEIALQIEGKSAKSYADFSMTEPTDPDTIRAEVLDWLVPVFTSRQYGQTAYMQLHLNCPEQITNGAEDGAEMGVFNSLKNSLRAANLRASLDEYLRFGLEAGIFFVT